MKKIGTLIIFLCSLFALIISLLLLYHVGIFADEFNTSPSAVYGSDFWNLMNWLKILLLAVTTVTSGILLVKKTK